MTSVRFMAFSFSRRKGFKDQGQSSKRLSSEIASRAGDAGKAGQSQQGNDQVTKGGHQVMGMADMQLGAVLIEDDIIATVANANMPANGCCFPFCWRLSGIFARISMSDGTFTAVISCNLTSLSSCLSGEITLFSRMKKP